MNGVTYTTIHEYGVISYIAVNKQIVVLYRLGTVLRQ